MPQDILLLIITITIEYNNYLPLIMQKNLCLMRGAFLFFEPKSVHTVKNTLTMKCYTERAVDKHPKNW